MPILQARAQRYARRRVMGVGIKCKHQPHAQKVVLVREAAPTKRYRGLIKKRTTSTRCTHQHGNSEEIGRGASNAKLRGCASDSWMVRQRRPPLRRCHRHRRHRPRNVRNGALPRQAKLEACGKARTTICTVYGTPYEMCGEGYVTESGTMQIRVADMTVEGHTSG